MGSGVPHVLFEFPYPHAGSHASSCSSFRALRPSPVHGSGNSVYGTFNLRISHSLDAKLKQPGTERVQALADISRSRCCHSNATHAPIANPPNSA